MNRDTDINMDTDTAMDTEKVQVRVHNYIHGSVSKFLLKFKLMFMDDFHWFSHAYYNDNFQDIDMNIVMVTGMNTDT